MITHSKLLLSDGQLETERMLKLALDDLYRSYRRDAEPILKRLTALYSTAPVYQWIQLEPHDEVKVQEAFAVMGILGTPPGEQV